jgi:tRNA 2-thiouridine synthesizing protein A
MIEFTVEVDASGLLCPLPLLRLKKALMTIDSGGVVKVIATDPAAHLDIGVFVEQAGHQLLGQVKHEGQQVFYVMKK